MKRYSSIKKTSLKVIIPFSIALFFSFPILIFYISDSFNTLKKNNAQMLVLKEHMESMYVIYSQQAKHRKNLFIRGFRQKDLDKYYRKISQSSKELYQEMDILFKKDNFKKYKPKLEKIKLAHIKSMKRYDEAVNVFVQENFDFLNADKLTRGHGKEIGRDILNIIDEIEADIIRSNSYKYSDLTNKLIYLSIILLLSYSVVMYFIIRVILNPLTRVSNLSNYVSNIDINALENYKKYPKDHSDDIGNLIDTINKFSMAIVDYNQNLQVKIKKRTQELDRTNNELTIINKNLTDAINYSTLLQDAIKPEQDGFQEYFKDTFIHWEPKNQVGGDIYFIDILPNKNESVVMCFDCTGHSIAGAFITMVVKSIQYEIIRKLSLKNVDISPAKILETFNQRLKDILKQHNKTSESNAGFDGGVVYINKADGILKYAGANMELISLVQNTATITKGDKYSVGYINCYYDYEYTDHIIPFDETIKIYLTTDGTTDTISDETHFRFGKNKLLKLIQKYQELPFEKQLQYYTQTIEEYRSGHEIVDDTCFIGLEIKREQ
jgi:serine phosphatase RsbU (regulator of sigma subunit)